MPRAQQSSRPASTANPQCFGDRRCVGAHEPQPTEGRLGMLIEFTLAKTHNRDAAAFTRFPNDLAKELSFGCMHESVGG